MNDTARARPYHHGDLRNALLDAARAGVTEGDVVNVLNLQSKRLVSGTVTGRGQVSISVATPRLAADSDVTSSISSNGTASPVSVASSPA